jgi:hypothetical protein
VRPGQHGIPAVDPGPPAIQVPDGVEAHLQMQLLQPGTDQVHRLGPTVVVDASLEPAVGVPPDLPERLDVLLELGGVHPNIVPINHGCAQAGASTAIPLRG